MSKVIKSASERHKHWHNKMSEQLTTKYKGSKSPFTKSRQAQMKDKKHDQVLNGREKIFAFLDRAKKVKLEL